MQKGEGVEPLKLIRSRFILRSSSSMPIKRNWAHRGLSCCRDAMTSELHDFGPDRRSRNSANSVMTNWWTPDLIKSYANYKIDQLSTVEEWLRGIWRKNIKESWRLWMIICKSQWCRPSQIRQQVHLYEYTSSPFDAPARFYGCQTDDNLLLPTRLIWTVSLVSFTIVSYWDFLVALPNMMLPTMRHWKRNQEIWSRQRKQNEAMYKFIEVEAKGDKKVYIDFAIRIWTRSLPTSVDICWDVCFTFQRFWWGHQEGGFPIPHRNHIGSQPLWCKWASQWCK